MALAPPTGNESLYINPLGVPCYSSSEPNYIECILIKALHPALSYLERSALAPGAENEIITVVPKPQREENEQERGEEEPQGLTDEAWAKMDDELKPAVAIVDPELIDQERGLTRMWKQFEETGEAPHPELGVEIRSDKEAILDPENGESSANPTEDNSLQNQ